MRTPTVVVITDAPAADDVALISDALDGFNLETTGTYDASPLAVLVKDAETNRVVGGLTGRTSLGLLFVDLLYLPPALRGSGFGSEILQIAEDEGLASDSNSPRVPGTLALSHSPAVASNLERGGREGRGRNKRETGTSVTASPLGRRKEEREGNGFTGMSIAVWARPATARAGRRGVGSGQSGQVRSGGGVRRGVWPGVLRRLKPALAEAGSRWSSRVLPGRADGSSACLHMAGSQDGGVVRWFPPVVLPSGPGPGRERFPRYSTNWGM